MLIRFQMSFTFAINVDPKLCRKALALMAVASFCADTCFGILREFVAQKIERTAGLSS
jgi:hypothetical protein